MTAVSPPAIDERRVANLGLTVEEVVARLAQEIGASTVDRPVGGQRAGLALGRPAQASIVCRWQIHEVEKLPFDLERVAPTRPARS